MLYLDNISRYFDLKFYLKRTDFAQFLIDNFPITDLSILLYVIVQIKLTNVKFYNKLLEFVKSVMNILQK